MPVDRELLEVGDRLISVTTPGEGGQYFKAGTDKVLSIAVNRLPGPMGFYAVANIIFDDDRPDLIIPLHMAASVEVLNP